MRILYDGQVYALQTAGGINRYFANLISRLPESYQPTLTTLNCSTKLNYPIHPRLKVFDYRYFRPYRLCKRVMKPYFQIASALGRFNLAHPTYYWLLCDREIQSFKCPIVVTAHDMIHEKFPQLDPEGKTIAAKRYAFQAAEAILSVSEKTRIDLLERYPELESKVTVIHLATELDANLAYGDGLVPSRPYFLYVGSRASTYKNFDGLLYAFAKAASVNSDIALCIVGSPFNGAELKLIEELKLSSQVEHYGHADDALLAKLYRCSVAFVYPSLYEGFGIPPLEAMACGTAVIASNSSSIPEVVGDAGILIDPKAINDLADSLLTLLDNPGERDQIIAKGKQRVQQFSWEKTAEQTLNVYRSLVN